MEALYQKYKDQGFIIITLITENAENAPPSVSELGVWADEYGETFPVLSDTSSYTEGFAKGKATLSLPVSTLIAPGGELLIANGDVSEAQIQAALP